METIAMLMQFQQYLIEIGRSDAADDLVRTVRLLPESPNSGRALGIIGQTCREYGLELAPVWEYLSA